MTDEPLPINPDSSKAVSAASPPTVTPDRIEGYVRWAIWTTALVFACGLTLADPDLWGHTLYGLRALEQGILCERTDPFSYTAPQAVWVNHEWLSEDIYGLLWWSFGNTGLWWWRNGCALTVFVVAAIELRRQQASLAATCTLWLLSGAGLSHFFVFIRPQLGTFALFAVTLCILRSWWQQPQITAAHEKPSHVSLWSLPVLLALWVNLHGGWLAGWGLIAVFWAGAGLRAWLTPTGRPHFYAISLAFTLATAATCVNPYGWQMHAMLWEHLATDQVVREWQPLWGARQSVVYYVPFVLCGLAVPGWRRWSWMDALVVLVVAAQAIQHIRHISLLGITLLCVLPGPLTAGLAGWFPQITQRWTQPAARYWRWGGSLAACVLLLGLQVRGSWLLWEKGVAPWEIAVETRSDVPGVPVPAVAFLKQNGLSGNLLTDYGWGQFAIWHLYPECPIGFDGRYRTIYNAQREEEFIAFQKVGSTRPAQTPMLDGHPTEIVLWPATRPVVDYLQQRADWGCVYADQQAVLFLKRIPRFEEVLRQHQATPRSQSATSDQATISEWQVFPGHWGTVPAVRTRPASVQLQR